MVDDDLNGASRVLRPAHADVANAIGAATSQVGGQIEGVYTLDNMTREQALDAAKAEAAERAAHIEDLRRCIDLAADGFGVIAGTPAVDTIKCVGEDETVVRTLDRDMLWHAHTPQVFPAGVLRGAYSDKSVEGTDDAALVEGLRSSLQIKMVDAGRLNLKVTYRSDLALAEAILTSVSDSS